MLLSRFYLSIPATIDGASYINRSPSQVHSVFSATPKARPVTHSQRWKRGRFSISRVIDDSYSAAIQHRFDRRFSAAPTLTDTQRRAGTNSSTLTSPSVWIRSQFKTTISPLALCGTSSSGPRMTPAHSNALKTSTSPKMLYSSSEFME